MSVVSIADLFKVGPPLTEAEQVGRALTIDALSDRAMAGETLTALRERLQTSDKRAVVLIDEAHLIGDWAPEDQAAIRALLKDEQRRLGVLLASSEDSAQSTLVPILHFLGEPFVVPHIAQEDWQHDLRERFKRADLSLEEPALQRLLDLSTGQPYCTMLLARQCAELGGAFGTVNVDVVELALPTVERHEAWQLLRYS
jgi:DNA polymerase III delta subunit